MSYTPKQKAAWAKKMQAAKAAKRSITGQGAYKKTKPRKPRKAASAASSTDEGWLAPALSTIGSFLPIPGGSAIGSGVGHLIKSLTGFGDYKIQENSLIPEANDPPTIDNTASGKVAIIKHREYISDVISSGTAGAFKVDSYFINPGQVASMPWLSGIAANYEHYQIRGMVFEFKTMSADALNSTNTALGQVIMATNYNAALANFPDKYSMENYEFASSTKPSCSMFHPIECKRSESVLGDLYVRPGSVPAGQDQRLYDFGNFQIASNGLQGTNVNLGELWVTYEIALYKPKLWTAAGNSVQIYRATGSNASSSDLFAGANPDGANTMALTLSSGVSPALITFPQQVKYGKFYFVYSFAGTTGTAVSIAGFGQNTNGTFSLVGANPTNGDTARSFSAYGLMSVTGAGPIAQLTCANVPTTSISWSLTVFQVPQAFS